MIIKKITVIIFFIFLLNGYIVYARGIAEENPNEISNYYQEQINNKIINPISVLRDLNLIIYNNIIEYISENESIENYYFKFTILSTEIGDTIAVYDIYYYEIFLIKYNSFRGDPTGKCFSIEFNLNNEFIRRYYWR
ncbi:MAG: hypothetical protein FWD28_09370 [Treponema sp.]|nr:hypothetical protein [Treponema sp.]